MLDERLTQPMRFVLSPRHLPLLAIVVLGTWALKKPDAVQNNDPSSTANSKRGNVPAANAGAKFVIKVAPKLFYLPGNVPMGVGKPLTGLDTVAHRYERLHPDTKIEYVSVPGAREWLVTQCTAGIAPDIVDVNVEEVWGDAHKGWYIPLDDYLNRPSAYAKPGEPGSERWSDVVKFPNISASVIGPDGKNYCFVYDMVETGIYYNKDIFRKVGVSVPENWKQFMETQKKLKEAGYIPFMVPIISLADWGTDLMFDQLYDGILPGIDIKPESESLKNFRDGYMEWDEVVVLNKHGFFTRNDPRWVEMWRLLKEWRQFMPQDLTSTNFIRQFLNQEAAMYWEGSWRVHQLMHDTAIDFEWDVFYLPPITKESSPYADGHPMVVIGGPGTQYVVTSSAISDTGTSATSEKLKRCIDFLQFLTTAESADTIVNEVAVFMPNVKGVAARKELERFDSFLTRRSSISKWQFTFDMRFNEIMQRMLELYVNDGIALDGYLGWMERNMKSASEALLGRQKPDLRNLEAQWKALGPKRAAMEGMPRDAL